MYSPIRLAFTITPLNDIPPTFKLLFVKPPAIVTPPRDVLFVGMKNNTTSLKEGKFLSMSVPLRATPFHCVSGINGLLTILFSPSPSNLSLCLVKNRTTLSYAFSAIPV